MAEPGFSPANVVAAAFRSPLVGLVLRMATQTMLYQLGWTTLPGLRGLSVSEFRAAPAAAPANQQGVAVYFANDALRDEFLRHLEEHFSSRRFTNAADAFDSVKAYAVELASKFKLST